jgi:hypothetical protein
MTMIGTWRERAEAKLADLLALPENWNWPAARRISPDAATHLLVLLDATMTEATPEPSIVPMNDGGLALEWHIHDVDLEVEVHGDGYIEITGADDRDDYDQHGSYRDMVAATETLGAWLRTLEGRA